ncbi:MAG: tetratricopeptide repeat protein, partial [Prosthecobacter sp.]|nr:tetratricopeptide repeat protein [Prosthecobacter sp.]
MKKIRLSLAVLLPVLPALVGVTSLAQEKKEEAKASPHHQEQVLLALHQKHRTATALSSQGRHSEAEAELREIVSTCRQVFGQEHPDTLISRSNL